MELSFSRGFSHGWLGGNDHKALVPGLSSAKRGVRLGHIERVVRDRVVVSLQRRVRRGDGLVFEGNRAESQETGGRVFEIFARGEAVAEVEGGTVELAFMRGAIDFSLLRPGLAVWKTDDPQLTQRLRRTFTGAESLRRMPLEIVVRAETGHRLTIDARAGRAACRVESPESLQAARKHPITVELLREQFGRLGGTPLELRHLEAHIAGGPMIPLSVLGKLRHAMVAELEAALAAAPARQIAAAPVLPGLRPAAEPSAGEPTLHVLCRSLGQVQQALEAGVQSLIADFGDIRLYGEATAAARAAGAAILLATPRIHKPGETGLFRTMARHGADGFLARNLAAADFCRQSGIAWTADFSLNAANELSAAWLRDVGAERITLSYDLNRDQIMELVAAVPRQWLEVVIHQHMPLFHMEHCVFCAVLSPGTNHTNCGRPCDRHTVRLGDRLGLEHPLTADVGCRNTLFNATPQSAAEVVPVLLGAGVRHFRVELLDIEGAEVEALIGLYRRLLAGELKGTEVWKQLRAANRLGVTRGTLEERRNPLAIL
jgi:putative protease